MSFRSACVLLGAFVAGAVAMASFFMFGPAVRQLTLKSGSFAPVACSVNADEAMTVVVYSDEWKSNLSIWTVSINAGGDCIKIEDDVRSAIHLNCKQMSDIVAAVDNYRFFSYNSAPPSGISGRSPIQITIVKGDRVKTVLTDLSQRSYSASDIGNQFHMETYGILRILQAILKDVDPERASGYEKYANHLATIEGDGSLPK